MLHPAMRWVLQRSGDVILDIGYGVYGAQVLNLLEGAHTDPDLRVYAVINLGRSMTSNKEEVVEYIENLGRVDGIINNSHLGEETSKEFIEEAVKVLAEVSKELNIPIIATAVSEEMASQFSKIDQDGNPVWVLHRYMPDTFW